MKPAGKIWFNYKIVPSTNKLFGFNQALNYGAAVYEGIRFYRTEQGPAIFRLHDHLDRFFYSAHTLRMKLGCNKQQLAAAIKKIIKINHLPCGYIRPISFFAEAKMGINILDTKVDTAIFTWPWNDREIPKPTCLKVVKYRRVGSDSLDVKAKIAGYYATALLGFIEARESGFDQPLFLDKNGFVAEGAINNIFIVKGKTIYTSKSNSILGGITRDTILTIAPDVDLRVRLINMKPEFLNTADEVFLTGTGIEMQPVTEVKRCFKNKNKAWPTTKLLLSYYQKIIQGKIKEYKKWLTYVN